MSEALGVTTYSSFFALNSFFKDVDVLIMDDVHSCEDYIISNWTIQIDSETTIFTEIAELLKNCISEVDYKYLLEEEYLPDVVLSRKLNDALSSRLFYAHFDSHRDISHFKSSCFCELFF